MKSSRLMRVLGVALAAAAPMLFHAQTTGFVFEETTIARVHAAMNANQLTCRQLVEFYLDRIARYDKPAINALGAKQGFIACSMSRTAASRFTGSLSRHCASLRRSTYIGSSLPPTLSPLPRLAARWGAREWS